MPGDGRGDPRRTVPVRHTSGGGEVVEGVEPAAELRREVDQLRRDLAEVREQPAVHTIQARPGPVGLPAALSITPSAPAWRAGFAGSHPESHLRVMPGQAWVPKVGRQGRDVRLLGTTSRTTKGDQGDKAREGLVALGYRVVRGLPVLPRTAGRCRRTPAVRCPRPRVQRHHGPPGSPCRAGRTSTSTPIPPFGIGHSATSSSSSTNTFALRPGRPERRTTAREEWP